MLFHRPYLMRGRVWVLVWSVAGAGAWAQTNEPAAVSSSPPARAEAAGVFHSDLSAPAPPAASSSGGVRPDEPLLGFQYAQSLESVLAHLEQARTRELEALQQSHRSTLITMGVLAGGAFLAILVLALALLRTLNRRVEVALRPPSGWPVGETIPLALSASEAQLATRSPTQAASQRLAGALDRLEQRIRELERGAPAQRPSTGAAVATSPVDPPRAGEPESGAGGAALLGKGESLLNLKQYEAALECFDEAVSASPAAAEAFVKRGAALEGLGRLDEAMASYDRAIALDNSLTTAYLHKGGIYSRLERYGEALQCYERALGNGPAQNGP